MGKDYYSKNKNEILGILKQKGYMTLDGIAKALMELKESNLVSNHLTQNDFYNRLLEDGLLSYSVSIRNVRKVRYSFNENFNIYEFVYSLESNGFFPMFTSLNIQGLSNFRDKFVFITKERKSRTEFKMRDLTQDAIDKAFRNSPKRTNAHDIIKNHSVVMLETNYTGEFGVINYDGYRVSSINRAFVEIISNIHYFKSPDDVINEFGKIKNKININEVFRTIEKFNFVYPYFQLAGYYLEEIGFQKYELEKFFNKKSKLNFYTMKNKASYSFDEYWQVFY
jgi:hypothetical protein